MTVDLPDDAYDAVSLLKKQLFSEAFLQISPELISRFNLTKNFFTQKRGVTWAPFFRLSKLSFENANDFFVSLDATCISSFSIACNAGP